MYCKIVIENLVMYLIMKVLGAVHKLCRLGRGVGSPKDDFYKIDPTSEKNRQGHSDPFGRKPSKKSVFV